MIDNSEALFVVKLPAGQKLIEYKQIPFMIAVALVFSRTWAQIF